MLYKIVDIADMKLSNDEDDIIVTYSLGSCVGLTLYDPVKKLGGMIHCMLPLSKIDTARAKSSPYMFVDVGVTKFLQEMFARGARKSSIVAKVAGGASMLDDSNMFNIGKRNYSLLSKLLDKNQIKISGEDVGGTVSRTVFLYVATGETTIRSNGKSIEL